MTRCHGSYIGHVPEPSASAASGIWKSCDASELLADGKWPSQPAVPNAPVGTAGDGQVILSWDALPTSPAVTDYGIQYSDDAGATWTTFTDSVSSATTAVVTGLTNDTAYIFRLYGVNPLGDGPYGSASAPVTPRPVIASLLMHFDGASGSTTFVDSSPNSFSVAARGDAQISTAQSKFGGASGYFDGSGDYVELAYDADLIPSGTEDLTIECWLRPGATQANGGIISTRLASVYSNFEVHLTSNFQLQVLVQFASAAAGWSVTLHSATSLAADQWSHMALVKMGDRVTLYINGVADVNITDYSIAAHGWYGGGSPSLYIGAGGDGPYNGYIDELRIVNGTAVYTANFTPPTAPY